MSEVKVIATVDPRDDVIAEAGMEAWDRAMKGPGPKTWFQVLPKVYRAMRARDPVFRAMRDALRQIADDKVMAVGTAQNALDKLKEESTIG